MQEIKIECKNTLVKGSLIRYISAPIFRVYGKVTQNHFHDLT